MHACLGFHTLLKKMSCFKTSHYMQGHSEMLGGKTHNVQCRVEALSPMNILDFKSPFLLVGLVLTVTCAITTSFITVH